MSEAVDTPAVIVSCAVPLPLPSKTTELGLREHVGAPACAGCTEQDRETGLSNALSKLRLTVEVALWPRPMVAGLAGDAEREKSVPTFNTTATKLFVCSTIIRSGALSPLKSLE